jgi:hypothetical protein
MNGLIAAAIGQRRLLKLAYTAGNRVVETHAYGVDGYGKELLRCFQVAGESASLGKRRWPVERSVAWVLENRRFGIRYDRLGVVIQSLLQAACIFLVAGWLARQF